MRRCLAVRLIEFAVRPVSEQLAIHRTGRRTAPNENKRRSFPGNVPRDTAALSLGQLGRTLRVAGSRN